MQMSYWRFAAMLATGHGRLVPMTVMYPSAPQSGFELSGGDGEQRAAEANLRIGETLEVGYDGFYGCGVQAAR